MRSIDVDELKNAKFLSPLIEAVIEKIRVENIDNKPIYHVRLIASGTYEDCHIRVSEDVVKGCENE